ncbi:SWI/SNF complex subunit SWI3C [Cyclospora cayetanensis]|uniref:SWI/SNF complex subunit SWI3C n=1 Tax=Cyclospora cayetanensis TaxID=88456 RepID=A0A6P6RSH1_9EIME|nr:SWI/SNF complex subunit SWI3C [Cyclospora cayetanensis]
MNTENRCFPRMPTERRKRTALVGWRGPRAKPAPTARGPRDCSSFAFLSGGSLSPRIAVLVLWVRQVLQPQKTSARPSFAMVPTGDNKESARSPGTVSAAVPRASDATEAEVVGASEADSAARKREALGAEPGAPEKKQKTEEDEISPAVPLEAMGPLGDISRPTSGGPTVTSSGTDREALSRLKGVQDQQHAQIGGEQVTIAPGVVQLASFDRNLHASVTLSRPSLFVESLPAQDLEGSLQASVGTHKVEEANRMPSEISPDGREGLLPDTPADRPPVALDEQKIKQRDEEAEADAAKAAAERPSFPSCSSWFDASKVSPLEQDILPALFAGSSLPEAEREEVYVHLRQAIIGQYRQNPQKHLSFTECRQLIPGDAALLLRVYSFLDYWGLINFQADSSTLPSSVRRKREFLMRDMQSWSRSSLYEKLQQQGEAAAAAAGAAAETSAAPQGEGPWRCVACGKICLYSYYVLRPGGTAGVSLGVMDNCVWCLRCHADGRYPHVLTARNFVKVDLLIAGSAADGSDWQLDETERLIEAIELHKDDWAEVAEHVGGGRTPQQCVERFIRLPTQEPFLDASKQVVSGTEKTPFSSFSNPLLSLLALLSSVVHPSVAAAAAHAALQKAVELSTPANSLQHPKQEQPASGNSNTAGASAAAAASAPATSAGGDAAANAVKQEPRSAAADDSSSSKELLIAEEALQVAAATALAAGAASAAEMLQVEKQNVGALLQSLVELQIRRVSLKLKKLHALEDAVTRSKQQVENKLSQLFSEHADLAAELEGARCLGPVGVLP